MVTRAVHANSANLAGGALEAKIILTQALIDLSVCFPRTLKVTLPPGPMNSGLTFWFLGNLQNSLFLLQSENYSVYWKNSDLSSDQKRSQIDRTNAVSNLFGFK